MPHDAELRRCPVTQQLIVRAPKPRSQPNMKQPAAAKRAAREPVMKETQPLGSAAGLEGIVLDGRYLLEELIGQGGMGAVYAAQHKLLRRKVAVKVLLSESLGEEARKRFEREARVTGALGHSHIVKVFDLGSMHDGSPFLVMEYLRGQSLAERLDDLGAMPAGEVIRVMGQVLDGLSAAHRKGVVHRDLKPDNIFLAETEVMATNLGRPHPVAKLLDFGVSKSLDENALALTRTGAVIGTPYYLSPEQARGDSKIDHRVDIWAAGVVLYEALTGALPFDAPNYNRLMVNILSGDAPPPSSARPGLPNALDDIVLKALRRDRNERFADAKEMLNALRAVPLDGPTSGEIITKHAREEDAPTNPVAARRKSDVSVDGFSLDASSYEIDVDIDMGFDEETSGDVDARAQTAYAEPEPDEDATLVSTEIRILGADSLGDERKRRRRSADNDATIVSDSFVFHELDEILAEERARQESGVAEDATEISDSFVRDGLKLPKSGDS